MKQAFVHLFYINILPILYNKLAEPFSGIFSSDLICFYKQAGFLTIFSLLVILSAIFYSVQVLFYWMKASRYEQA